MPEWVTMRYAAEQLDVSPGTLSRFAAKGKIQTKEDPTDERVKLVDLDELRRLYAVRSNRKKMKG